MMIVENVLALLSPSSTIWSSPDEDDEEEEEAEEESAVEDEDEPATQYNLHQL